ncbi:cyclic nucleotide-binding protein [Stylonychia lemnae]|uniref:Cyclic nucleotide-binding protein n=1 Tax=Stylonychia lemnae TaxID=5949 RepID=A0A078B138_STYLE|nr:cyclic nucleotide-binding protein [Stylonychia lemnae]|eukprot:CDW87072.1 cyclic nucleotide-binding protein [Stylonychia lemnae]
MSTEKSSSAINLAQGKSMPAIDSEEYKNLTMKEKKMLALMTEKKQTEQKRVTKTQKTQEEVLKKFKLKHDLLKKKDGDHDLLVDGHSEKIQPTYHRAITTSASEVYMEQQDPEFMIRCRSKFKLYWDIVIIIMALYNSIIIPVEIAFNPMELNSAAEITIESLINLVFMIDIFLNFRITYISSISGDEIFDARMITQNYLTNGRFVLDVLSSIPFNAVGSSSDILPILGMLKLFRVGRISIVIRNLNMSADTKAFLRVLWLIFFLFMYTHIIGCLWFYVVNQNDKWVPKKDQIFEDQFAYEVYSSGLLRQYLVAFYTAYFLIAGGEMSPQTDTEITLAFIIMLFSSMVLANIFVQMTVLNSQINHKTMKFQEQLDTINTAMENLALPSNLKKEIKEYFINTFSRMDQQRELNHFLDDISPSLRLQISFQIFHVALESNIVFHSFLSGHGSGHDQHGGHGDQGGHGSSVDAGGEHSIMNFIVKRLKVELATPEQIFVSQDDEVTEDTCYMFFLAKGDCVVMIKDRVQDGHEEIKHRSLLPGDHFGEISMIYGCARTATVKANNYCTLAKLSKEHFEEMIHKTPQLLDKFKTKIYHYDDNVKLFLEKQLDSIDYLQSVPFQTKHDLMYKLKKMNFEKDGFLYKIDDIATRMYIIQQGEVQIELTLGDETFVIEKLTRGCILNHRGFLFADQNDTNARCTTTVTCYALDIDDLENIRKDSKELDESVKELEKYLLSLKNPIALDYILKFPREKRSPRSFDLEKRRNQLTVQLKNAATQIWLKIREERKKPKLNEILKMIIKKRRDEAKNKGKPKKEEDKKILPTMALNLDPISKKYHELYNEIFNINMKILDTGNEIDSIEWKVVNLQKEVKADKKKKI